MSQPPEQATPRKPLRHGQTKISVMGQQRASAWEQHESPENDLPDGAVSSSAGKLYPDLTDYMVPHSSHQTMNHMVPFSSYQPTAHMVPYSSYQTKTNNGWSFKTRSCTWIIPVLGILLLLFTGGGVSYNMYRSSKDWKSMQDRMEELVGNLQIVFPSQDKELWIAIRAGMTSLLTEKEPTKPFVLLMLSKGARSESLCLAKEIGKSFAEVMSGSTNDPLIISDPAIISKGSPEEESKELRDMIHSHFDSGHYVVVLDNLLRIPPRKFYTLLHGMCDDSQAPYKRVMYVFPVEYESGPANSTKPEETAEYILERAWKGRLEKDKYPSLISRLTTNVIEISPEENFKECN